MRFISKEGVVKVFRNTYIDEEIDESLKKAAKEYGMRSVNGLIAKVLERIAKDKKLLKSILN